MVDVQPPPLALEPLQCPLQHWLYQVAAAKAAAGAAAAAAAATAAAAAVHFAPDAQQMEL